MKAIGRALAHTATTAVTVRKRPAPAALEKAAAVALRPRAPAVDPGALPAVLLEAKQSPHLQTGGSTPRCHQSGSEAGGGNGTTHNIEKER